VELCPCILYMDCLMSEGRNLRLLFKVAGSGSNSILSRIRQRVTVRIPLHHAVHNAMNALSIHIALRSTTQSTKAVYWGSNWVCSQCRRFQLRRADIDQVLRPAVISHITLPRQYSTSTPVNILCYDPSGGGHKQLTLLKLLMSDTSIRWSLRTSSNDGRFY
jgi:hypothetical protein